MSDILIPEKLTNLEGGALQEFQIINPERVFVENPDIDEETIEEDGVVDENDIPFKRHSKNGIS
jgi:hypothetical protein